jgi:hypothetical protein
LHVTRCACRIGPAAALLSAKAGNSLIVMRIGLNASDRRLPAAGRSRAPRP